jgi:hypothetical protein
MHLDRPCTPHPLIAPGAKFLILTTVLDGALAEACLFGWLSVPLMIVYAER